MSGTPCQPVMTRTQAEELVKAAFLEVLRRDPFHPFDSGAYDHVFALMHGTTPDEVEATLRESAEAREKAEDLVRGLYRELFGRDPGPEQPGGPWVDPPARAYAEDFRAGVKSEEDIRTELRSSEEYVARPAVHPSRAPSIEGTSLIERDTGERSLPLGISLFYGLSLGVPRDRFQTVVDELASAQIRECRLSMSTFTWGNEQGVPEVIPFKPGSVHDGFSNEVSEAFLNEMEWRLDHAVSRGVRPQLTLLWGGFQPLFVQNRSVRENALGKYLRAVCERLRSHPAVTIEIMNEIDHGHHLGFLTLEGRKEFLKKWVSACKEILPDALFSVSDGGHAPRGGGEGDAYFDYHDVPEIDYWNVHFPRDEVAVEGIPRWCRGIWHLNGEWHFFQSGHGGRGGYGRNDENMFLQTEEDHREWPYRNSTRDWRMYGLHIFVAATAKAATTIHNQSGFFCRPGVGSEPVMKVARCYAAVMKDFSLEGSSSLNASWRDSPVESFDGPFKAFTLVGGPDRRDILVTVLNPREGTLTLDLKREYEARVYEITGEERKRERLPAGKTTFRLPPTEWPHGCIVRLAAERSV
jgi:hypothetical protein